MGEDFIRRTDASAAGGSSLITRRRQLVVLDDEVIARESRKMIMGLQLEGHKRVMVEVSRFPNTKDAELTVMGEIG